jgi:elongation factor 3
MQMWLSLHCNALTIDLVVCCLQAEDGTLQKLKVDKLLGRRKLKKDYEYEVQWQGKGPEAATWLTRDDLVEMGLEKMVIDLDMKEAARAVSCTTD